MKTALINYVRTMSYCSQGVSDESVNDNQTLSTENITFSFNKIEYLHSQ